MEKSDLEVKPVPRRKKSGDDPKGDHAPAEPRRSGVVLDAKPPVTSKGTAEKRVTFAPDKPPAIAAQTDATAAKQNVPTPKAVDTPADPMVPALTGVSTGHRDADAPKAAVAVSEDEARAKPRPRAWAPVNPKWVMYLDPSPTGEDYSYLHRTRGVRYLVDGKTGRVKSTARLDEADLPLFYGATLETAELWLRIELERQADDARKQIDLEVANLNRQADLQNDGGSGGGGSGGSGGGSGGGGGADSNRQGGGLVVLALVLAKFLLF